MTRNLERVEKVDGMDVEREERKEEEMAGWRDEGEKRGTERPGEEMLIHKRCVPTFPFRK